MFVDRGSANARFTVRAGLGYAANDSATGFSSPTPTTTLRSEAVRGQMRKVPALLALLGDAGLLVKCTTPVTLMCV